MPILDCIGFFLQILNHIFIFSDFLGTSYVNHSLDR